MKELLWNNLEDAGSRRPSAHFSFSGCARTSFNKQALETQESASGHLERASTSLKKIHLQKINPRMIKKNYKYRYFVKPGKVVYVPRPFSRQKGSILTCYTCICSCTNKKEKKISLIYKECMRRCANIWS